jgi:hypothetical protein
MSAPPTSTWRRPRTPRPAHQPQQRKDALKTVPVDELKEKALTSLAKVSISASDLLLVYSYVFSLIFSIFSTWSCFVEFIDK